MVSKYFRFSVRHLDFRWNGASHNVGNYTVEILDPENMGMDIRIMSVSHPVPELQGWKRYISQLAFSTKNPQTPLSFQMTSLGDRLEFLYA
jgi:hypothetical protein